MKKYAIINLWKTPASGPIYVSATSDNLQELAEILGEHDEIVRCFEAGGKKYYSRDLAECKKTFIAR